MSTFLVSVLGPDRPGIVASVTNALAQDGFNLSDTSMTRLGGFFTMLLLVESAGEVNADSLYELLANIDGRETLQVNVSAADGVEKPDSSDVGERWAISLYGADQPGIVAAVTDYLASVGANISDLSTRATGDSSVALYTMLLDVTLPLGLEGGQVSIELDKRAAALGVTCHARLIDVDTF